MKSPTALKTAGKRTHLAAAGYDIETRDLTRERWTSASLRAYFAEKPVEAWFDLRAPRIVSGEIDPCSINAQAALVMMAVDPSLIKSPLVKFHGRCGAGLDSVELESFLASAAQAKARRSTPRSVA